MSAARTISWEEYQKLPEDKRSRPLTDAEYKKLSPAQLQTAGLAESDEGAPADFNGPVFPNPDHIQIHDDSESNIPVTRLPRGVTFNRGLYRGDASSDLSNPAAADIKPAAMREMAANMSDKPGEKTGKMPWENYATAPPTAKQGDEQGPWVQYGKKGASSTAEKPKEPGLLDRVLDPLPTVPISGPWYNPTLSGLQSVGRGLRDAIKGAGATLDPRAHNVAEEAMIGSDPRARVALPIVRTLRGIGQTAKQVPEIPGAIHDINASPDPLSHYAQAAQDTAGQGAGQAILALGTEGVGKVVPPVTRGIGKGVRATGEVLRDVATPENIGTAAGGAVGGAIGHTLGSPFEAGAGGAVIGRTLGRAIAKRLASGAEEGAPSVLDATGENKPFAGGLDEPKPGKPLDATGENKPFAGGMDEYAAPKAKLGTPETKLGKSGTIPSPSETRIAPPSEVSAQPLGETAPAATPGPAPRIAPPTEATASDPILARLQEHANNIQAEEGARVPEGDEDLVPMLRESVVRARASRGLAPVGEEPAPLAVNASGESAASQEAINRVTSNKMQGIRRFRIDTRSGREVPLFGPDAVDASAGPYDAIVERGPKGETTIDQGARARPYQAKGSVVGP